MVLANSSRVRIVPRESGSLPMPYWALFQIPQKYPETLKYNVFGCKI